MKTVFARTIYEKAYRRSDRTLMDLIKGCGANTGNVCFVDAVEEQLNFEDIIYATDIGKYPGHQNTVFVVPAANWLNPYDNFPIAIANVIKNTSAKVLLLGVGIHMVQDINTPRKLINSLSKEAKEAWHIISNHSDIIGCRGDCTVESFRLMNINNSIALGCPSFYNPYLKILNMAQKYSDGNNTNNIVKNLCTDWLKRGEEGDLAWNIAPGCENEKIFNLFKKNGGIFICQDIVDVEALRRLDCENKFLGEWGGVKMYFEKSTWSEFLTKNATISVGPRFHGNMMAFISGVRALWVEKDARTNEMIEYMHLPSVKMHHLKPNTTLAELVSKAKYDDVFFDNYISLSKKYIKVLDELKINHNFGA